MLWLPCHRGAQDAPLDKDIDLHIEDSETTGLDNDNESTSGSGLLQVALGGPEVEGHLDDLIHSNQAKLLALTKEIK